MTDREELKRLAEAASPGPWRRCVGTGAIEIRSEAIIDVPNPRVCRVLRADDFAEENAGFIAAANPAAILDLLAQLEAKEAEIAELKDDHAKAVSDLSGSVEYLESQLNALRASSDADIERAMRFVMDKVAPHDWSSIEDWKKNILIAGLLADFAQMKEPTA